MRGRISGPAAQACPLFFSNILGGFYRGLFVNFRNLRASIAKRVDFFPAQWRAGPVFGVGYGGALGFLPSARAAEKKTSMFSYQQVSQLGRNLPGRKQTTNRYNCICEIF